MKTINLLLFLLLTGSIAFAMGYPQDMFAEQVVAKPTAKASASLTNKKKPSTIASLEKKKNLHSKPAKPAEVRPVGVSQRPKSGVYEAGLGSSAVLGMTIRMIEEQVKINGVRPHIRFSDLPLGRLFGYLKERFITFIQ